MDETAGLMRRVGSLLPITLALIGCGAPAPTVGFVPATYRDPLSGERVPYTVFVPHVRPAGQMLPVLLFLHGAGEAGTDGRKPTTVGLGPAIRTREADFPFLVVFPQIRERIPGTHGSWLPTEPDGRRALAMLAETMAKYDGDPDRVSITGLSVGGSGTWQHAAADPGRWAAVVPICGVGPASKAERIAPLPVWCYHGADDRVVNVEMSRRMIEALKEAGGTPTFTEYAGVGHDSWERAYGEAGLWEWLLKQRRRRE